MDRVSIASYQSHFNQQLTRLILIIATPSESCEYCLYFQIEISSIVQVLLFNKVIFGICESQRSIAKQMETNRSQQKRRIKRKSQGTVEHQSVQKQYKDLIKNINRNYPTTWSSKSSICLPKIVKLSLIDENSKETSMQQASTHPMGTSSNNNQETKGENEANVTNSIQPNDTNQQLFIDSINEGVFREAQLKVEENKVVEETHRPAVRRKRVVVSEAKCQKFLLKEYKESLDRFRRKARREIGELSLNIMGYLNRSETKIKSVLLEQELDQERSNLAQQPNSTNKFKPILRKLPKSQDCVDENWVPTLFRKALPPNKQCQSEEKKVQRLSTACRKKVRMLLQMQMEAIR